MNQLTSGFDFNGYLLQEQIGKGSSAEVWRVMSTKNDKNYALKIYTPSNSFDDAEKEIFREEFEKSLGLRHPNILHPIEYGVFDNNPYIVMPLAIASLMSDLQQRMMERKIANTNYLNLYSEEELAQIINDVSNALKFLGTNGIIHRDIKPDNVLIFDFNGRNFYCITDFGVSDSIRKTIQRHAPNPSTGRGMTPAYAAPELYQGIQHKNTDVFSLGVSLYELSCGSLPIPNNTVGIGVAMLNGNEVNELPGGYSRRLKELIGQMLKSNPDERVSPRFLAESSYFFLINGYWPDMLEDKIQEASKVIPANLYSPQRTQLDPIASTQTFGDSAPSFNPSFGDSYPFPDFKPKKKWASKPFIIAIATLLILIGAIAIFQYSRYKSMKQKATNYMSNGEFKLAAFQFRSLGSKYDELANRLEVASTNKTISPIFNGFYKVKSNNNNLYGFINSRIIALTPCKYTSVQPFNTKGYATVCISTNGINQYGVIDTNGVEVVAPEYRGCYFKVNDPCNIILNKDNKQNIIFKIPNCN